MKIGRSLFWMLVLMLVAATYWFGFMRDVQETPPEDRPIPVEILELARGTIEQTIELTGWITPHKTLHIASKVAGRIESLSNVTAQGEQVDLDVGTVVQHGQTLVCLDCEMYDIRMAAARARPSGCLAKTSLRWNGRSRRASRCCGRLT